MLTVSITPLHLRPSHSCFVWKLAHRCIPNFTLANARDRFCPLHHCTLFAPFRRFSAPGIRLLPFISHESFSPLGLFGILHTAVAQALTPLSSSAPPQLAGVPRKFSNLAAHWILSCPSGPCGSIPSQSPLVTQKNPCRRS